MKSLGLIAILFACGAFWSVIPASPPDLPALSESRLDLQVGDLYCKQVNPYANSGGVCYVKSNSCSCALFGDGVLTIMYKGFAVVVPFNECRGCDGTRSYDSGCAEQQQLGPDRISVIEQDTQVLKAGKCGSHKTASCDIDKELLTGKFLCVEGVKSKPLCNSVANFQVISHTCRWRGPG
ncbi:MAG: hypothetical protein JWP89_1330 [Schlesneria sp.]|nr:hypothetical protein [Schlesneria sp.]